MGPWTWVGKPHQKVWPCNCRSYASCNRRVVVNTPGLSRADDYESDYQTCIGCTRKAATTCVVATTLIDRSKHQKFGAKIWFCE